jgi:hypothetical protein
MPDAVTDMLDYATQIAELLGQPWRCANIDDAADSAADAVLIGPREGRISLTLDAWHRQIPRVIAESWLPRDLTDHKPAGARRPVITFSAQRTAPAAAAQLRRRLLGPFQQLIAQARDNRQRHDATIAAQQRILDAIADALGPAADRSADSIVHTASGRTFSATVPLSAVRDRPVGVRIQIDTTAEHAVQIVRLLAAEDTTSTTRPHTS